MPGAHNYHYPTWDQYNVSSFANLSFPPLPTVESCSMTGARKDSFDLGEPVHINGTGCAPSTTYDLYIVNDTTPWIDGLSIPARVPGTATTVSSDGLGSIPPSAAWSDPQTIGHYDIVVDINGNGIYEANVDVLDDNDINVTAGFYIPEFSSILPLLLLGALTTILACNKRRTR